MNKSAVFSLTTFPYNCTTSSFIFAFSVYPLKDTLSSDLKADSFNDEAFETGK